MNETNTNLPDESPEPSETIEPIETSEMTGTMIKGASQRALATAIKFLEAWEEQRAQRPLDRILETEFRNRRDLNSSERRWISSLIFGTVRLLRRQEFLLQKLGLPVNPEHLARLWAQSPGDGEPGTVFRHTPPLVSEEQLQAALVALPTPETPAEFLRVTLSFPDAMATELEALLGTKEAILAAESLNQQAAITLRVNTLKTTPARLLPRLPPGLATPTRYSPVGIELKGRVNMTTLLGWRDGYFEAQEEASQIVCQFLDVKPGETVIDVGAGAGGKTLALAAMMEGRGRLIALDLPSPRLGQLQERARRAGVQNFEIIVIHADERGDWQPEEVAKRKLDKLTLKADAVMVDAPCSGSGVIRRNPDTKWRETDLAEFARLQLKILTQSAPFVKPGGRLLYVTCAFEREQNEAVVATFLASEVGAEFHVEVSVPPPFAPFATGELTAIRTWAHRHSMDCFFAIRLYRKELDSARPNQIRAETPD